MVIAQHHELGELHFHAEPGATLLFCDNETNTARLWGRPSATPYVKDGINDYVVGGREGAVNPAREGTKAAAHRRLVVPPGAAATVRTRLTAWPDPDPFGGFDEIVEARRAEADDFYDAITPPSVGGDARSVMRQALAGMLWSKQAYYFDLDVWLRERSA